MTKPSASGDRDFLDQVASVWEAHAQADPLWAVLSEPDRSGRRWDLPSFLATGVDQVEKSLGRFSELGGQFADLDTALDFGCGVGRLSQPLAKHFARVVGIDISPTMIAAATELNQHLDRVEYRVNDQPDLAFLPDDSVSLVYSHITLQHMNPSLAVEYLREFFRVVKPGGGVIFQIPSHLTDEYLPSDSDDLAVEAENRLASISIGDCPRKFLCGEERTIRVRVVNKSNQPWIQSKSNPLKVGNHWVHRIRDGIHDDGRARIPGRLPPGESSELLLTVRAPESPGVYCLKVDVVQEGIAWFEGSGGEIARRWIWVRRNPGGQPSTSSVPKAYPGEELGCVIPATWAEPVAFEMNGIERESVEEVILELGGSVLGTDEWVTEWFSYTYYVQVK